MNERLRALTDGFDAVSDTLSELEPLMMIETLSKENVNLLIDRILIHGNNDIEIVWNDQYGD